MMRNKKRQKSVYIRETVPYVYSTVNIFPVLGGTDVGTVVLASGYKLGPLDPLRGLKCKYSKNSKKSNITLLDLLLLSLNSS
jgi:hypothetical protein